MRTHSTRAKPRSISACGAERERLVRQVGRGERLQQLARRGPCTLICAYAPVTSVTKAWASADVPAQVRLDVAVRGVGGDDEEGWSSPAW